MHDFIVTDTETGGFYPQLNALLSIGAVCSWDANLTFEAYITLDSQPGKTVTEEAAKKNGYSREAWELLNARALDIVIPEFLQWLDARKKERAAPIVCHNLAFDKPFLSEGARICSLDMPHRNDWRCSQVKFGELMDQGLIEKGSSSLDRLRELSGYAPERHEHHNALQDCFITAHGYRWLHAKARTAEATVKHLYDLACQDRRRLERLVCEIADNLNHTAAWEAGNKIVQIISHEAQNIRKEGR